MIQDIGDKHFDNQYRTRPAEDSDYVVAFRKADKGPDEILVGTNENKIVLPRLSEFAECDEIRDKLTYLFRVDDECFYLLAGDVDYEDPEGYEFQSSRVLRCCEPAYIGLATATACHLNLWYKNNQFCGRCGHKMHHDMAERMMRCSSCGNMVFPKIQPAVSVALIRRDAINGDKLLVTRYSGRTVGMALVAGFVEIGETAEQCVAREVMEEVGLKVKNIKQYANQPWGFAGNLQMGYWAEVDGDDEITLDHNELADARFIGRDEIPENQNMISLTGTMIDLFRQGREYETL